MSADRAPSRPASRDRPRPPSPGAPTARAARGRAGEDRVAALYAAEDWVILARNWRTRGGEIDIIARRDGILAFVEVKSWARLGRADLAAGLPPRKRRRIVETSKIFLARNREYSSARLRYDVILLQGERIAFRAESAFSGDV